MKFEDVVAFVKSTFGVKDEFIPLHEPRFIGNEREYVLDCIDSTFVSSVGKYVNLFEDKVKEFTGAKYAIATTNGSSALHLSLLLAGVKRDELVITQSLTFIATCNAISYIGAQPLFVDVDRQTLGMSAEKLEAFLLKETEINSTGELIHIQSKKRIAACVPMHTFGHPIEIESIVEICNRFNLPLIEDAAESLGSTYKGKQTGRFGLLGTYSFNGNKTITCGGGGMIVTDDDQLGYMAKHLSTQAKKPHRWNFEHDHIGFNYRLPNLNAAMACAQMEQLDSFITNKRELASIYSAFFDQSGITFVSEPIDSKSNYWLNSVLLSDKDERDLFLTYTNDNNVMTRPVWTLMNKLEMFKNALHGDLSNAEWLEDRLVNIPSSVRI
jgi:aminotransferase in exopolysaccharide biosynthesis